MRERRGGTGSHTAFGGSVSWLTHLPITHFRLIYLENSTKLSNNILRKVLALINFQCLYARIFTSARETPAYALVHHFIKYDAFLNTNLS